MTKNAAYDDLIAAGVKVESHESDLYCPVSEVSQRILNAHACDYATFRDSEGVLWFEAPFEFMPYWRNLVKV